jgi:hypothetical protein
MTVRILIVDPDSLAPMFGMNGNHGDDHAAAWAVTMADAVEAQTGVRPLVIDYDPEEGGNVATDDIRAIHEVRLTAHPRPDGKVEMVGIGRGSRNCAKAIRVLDGPPRFIRSSAGIRGKGQSLEDRAARWQLATDPAARRIARRLNSGGA